jgi:hypothetical protein
MTDYLSTPFYSDHIFVISHYGNKRFFRTSADCDRSIHCGQLCNTFRKSQGMELGIILADIVLVRIQFSLFWHVSFLHLHLLTSTGKFRGMFFSIFFFLGPYTVLVICLLDYHCVTWGFRWVMQCHWDLCSLLGLLSHRFWMED